MPVLRLYNIFFFSVLMWSLSGILLGMFLACQFLMDRDLWCPCLRLIVANVAVPKSGLFGSYVNATVMFLACQFLVDRDLRCPCLRLVVANAVVLSFSLFRSCVLL